MRTTDHLHHQLRRMAALRRMRDPRRQQHERRLAGWQSQRLRRTHDDLLRHPKSRPAIAFFFDHIYLDRDFSRRDDDLERIAPLVSRVLPERALGTLGLVLEMNALTRELDAALVDVLEDTPEALDERRYAEAVHRLGDRAARTRQIELIQIVGDDLDRLVGHPLVLTALRFSRTPARVAGLGELHQMLEAGCDAFRRVGGAHDVLRVIVRREKAILERMLAGHPRPFEVEER